MKTLKNVLIVHDGIDALKDVARKIAGTLKGLRVVVMEAADFSATDLLPADAYFFGCTKRRPSSFMELERVLIGINLAGRTCGLFTLESTDAIEYLRHIIRDAELRVNPEPFFFNKDDDLEAWIQTTLQGS